MKDNITLSVKNCARCNQTHDVDFMRFIQPIEDTDGTTWTYWGMCPVNNEPILMKTENKDE